MLVKTIKAGKIRVPNGANKVLRIGNVVTKWGIFKSTFGKEVMKETLFKGVLHKRFDLPKNEVLLVKTIKAGKIRVHTKRMF